MGQNVDKYFIVGDGQLIEVEKNASPLCAFDLLFKLHYVMNVEFARSLLYFYNFLEVFFYKSNEARMSSVISLHTSIKNVNLDSDDDYDD